MFVMLSIVMLAEAMPVQLPRIRGTVSVSFPVMHASAMIFGPLAGAWVAAVGSLRPRDLEGQVGWVPFLFNRLQLAASTYAAGSVFQYMSGDLTNYSDPRSIMAVVASGGMYLLLNMTAITIFSSIVDKRSPLRVWWTGLTWALPNTLALLPISYLVATTYQVLNLIAPLFLALPLLVARYSYQRYVDMRNQYIDTIRSLAAALEAKDPRTYGHADRVSQLSMADRKSTRLNSSHVKISYAVFCLKKKVTRPKSATSRWSRHASPTLRQRIGESVRPTLAFSSSGRRSDPRA